MHRDAAAFFEVKTMESIKQYLQDWSDACEYAKECAPDLSFLKAVKPGEPYTALLGIAVGCFLLWAVNEWRIKRRRSPRSAIVAPEGLQAVLGRMTPHRNKLAA